MRASFRKLREGDNEDIDDCDDDLHDNDEKKKKERATNSVKFAVKRIVKGFGAIFLIVLFLVGQYILAGKLVDNSIISREQKGYFIAKHRRNVAALPPTQPSSSSTPKLQFPSTYHVLGVLKLPYGDINEPFEAWYSKDEKMSRIDYYGGMDRTYQREDLADYGFGAKIIPEFSEEKKKIFRGCLHHVGTKRFPIKAQSIIPSETSFVFAGKCVYNKTIPCYKWKHTFKVLTKINSYTLYTSRDQLSVPLEYDMMGYDTLLASYYDKYVLSYTKFEAWKYDFAVFEIPPNVHCFDLSGESEANEDTVASFNPMLEFMTSHLQSSSSSSSSNEEEDGDETTVPVNDNKNKTSAVDSNDDQGDFTTKNQSSSPLTNTLTLSRNGTTGTTDGAVRAGPNNHFEFVVEKIFTDYKNLFQKEYNDPREHVKRKDIFRHNLRYINHKNRQNLTYKLHLNHFADVTDEEMKHYRGLLNESYVDHNASLFEPPPVDYSKVAVPMTLDWRKYGAVSEVSSQGICGSCYAYAVTGAVEAAHYIKTGKRIKLSEQQLVDCTWGFGNRGCKGGYPYRAMQWIIKHGGIATAQSYGKYLAQEGYCHFENVTHGAQVEGYYNISQGNISQLKQAIALYGPVTVLINTRPKSFKFYDSGVYLDKECDQKLDHAALVVGYGTTENGEDYWLIKNSWSISWGRKGFMKIAMRGDICGVTQKAVVVKVK